MPLRGDCLLPIYQGVALGWGLIAPSGRYRIHTDNHSHPFMANYMIIICSFLLYVVLCCLMLFDSFYANWYSGIFFFLCEQKEETRKNREHAPPLVVIAPHSPNSPKQEIRAVLSYSYQTPDKKYATETVPCRRHTLIFLIFFVLQGCIFLFLSVK